MKISGAEPQRSDIAARDMDAARRVPIDLRPLAQAAVVRIGKAPLVVYAASFGFYLVIGVILIAQLGITGDEPWYLMLGYSLVHNHTANLAAIIHNPPLYHTFTSHWDDHTGDYLGNGERVLPNLPGYALILGLATLVAGRVGIVVVQAGATALTATLLYAEGRRLFASRAAGLFAAAAFALALPATVYVSQMFPSALASSAAFAGFVLAMRALPSSRTAARGHQRLLAALGVGLLAALLPWLHFKYALVAVALVALALVRITVVRVSRGGVRLSTDRESLRAAAIILGSVVVSFVLIAVYCRHYFGTWTPQYSTASGSAMDFAHPSLPRALALYTDMFASNQSGLFPWVPLDLLLIPGIVLLRHRTRAAAGGVLLLIGAQLAGFLPVLFTPAVYQGYALPSRFTVECAPFFALCVAAVFARGLPALRTDVKSSLVYLRHLTDKPPPPDEVRLMPGVGARLVTPAQRVVHRLLSTNSGHSGSMPFAPARAALLRQHTAAIASGVSLVLLLAGGWLLLVALTGPGLLYASNAGNRLAERDPALVPAWWFAAFPDPGHVVKYSQTVALAVDPSATKSPSGTTNVTARAELPPGEYTAAFTWRCTLASTGDASGALHVAVVRVTAAHSVLAQRDEPAATCDDATHTVRVPAFGSDGYDATRFTITTPQGTALTVASAFYEPR